MAFSFSTEPAISRISLIKGDSIDFNLDVFQGDGVTPLLLTGYNVSGKIEAATSPSTQYSFSITKDESSIRVYLSPSISLSLPTNCVWDIQIFKADETIRRTIARGTLTVLPQVTTD